MERVLIVEDHERLASSIADGLRDQGYAADIAHDGETATRLAKTESYDVILLDLMIPRKDGFAVLQSLRGAGLKTPVLCLTAKDAVTDKVRGLDCGADDYLVKPFDWSELLARTRVLIRRGHGQSHGVIEIADLKIDTLQRRVERAGKPIQLTAREYELLQFMAFRQNHVLSRSDIWDHLYDRNEENSSNVVDVYIGYLRNKIDRDFEPKLIHTRRGMGYVLTAEV